MVTYWYRSAFHGNNKFKLRFKKIFIMSLAVSSALLYLLWILVMDAQSSGIFSRVVKLNVRNRLCYVNYNDERSNIVKNETDIKMIYYITPTHPRPEQIPELTRLSHTLMHVPRLHWIVADDYPDCSKLVLSVLRKTGLPFTYISSPKPYQYKGSTSFPRGVANRRAALSWLNENISDGILYFGDDDNTVDLELFEEIRQTKRVSMFPVGLIGNYGVSTPIVYNGKVVAFFDSWPGMRTYPIDMAGFAVNIQYLKPNAIMPYTEGLEEDMFLVSLGLKIEDIEPLAANCSKSKGVGVINAAATGMGLLSNKGPQPWHPASDDVKERCRRASEYCKQHNVELARIATWFTLSQPGIDTNVCGFYNIHQLKDTLQAYEQGLTDHEKQVLADVQIRFFDRVTLHWDDVELQAYKETLNKMNINKGH